VGEGSEWRVAVNADCHTHQAFIENAEPIHLAVDACGVEGVDLRLQIDPQRMQRPAGAIAVLGFEAQRCMLFRQVSQQVALLVVQIGKGANTKAPQDGCFSICCTSEWALPRPRNISR
jgi:hypothetical protein